MYTPQKKKLYPENVLVRDEEKPEKMEKQNQQQHHSKRKQVWSEFSYTLIKRHDEI